MSDDLKAIADDLRVEAMGKRAFVENMQDLIAGGKKKWPEDDLDRKLARAAVLDQAADIIENLARAS